jgi:hypothetical protein
VKRLDVCSKAMPFRPSGEHTKSVDLLNKCSGQDACTENEEDA